MAIDLTIQLADEPGVLARLGEVLGTAGVNIEGFCAVTSGGGLAEIHILVEDGEAAFRALGAADIGVETEQEVAVIEVEDRPGVLGEISSKLGASGINMTVAYMATNTRLVFAADDLAGAKALLDV